MVQITVLWKCELGDCNVTVTVFCREATQEWNQSTLDQRKCTAEPQSHSRLLALSNVLRYTTPEREGFIWESRLRLQQLWWFHRPKVHLVLPNRLFPGHLLATSWLAPKWALALTRWLWLIQMFSAWPTKYSCYGKCCLPFWAHWKKGGT